MVKLSLAMIVKATDEEAKLLDRCLKSVKGVFDEICITITGDNQKCEYVAKKHKAKISHFTWINDFAEARNFNFSQASGDFVMWLDADDYVRGAENIREIAEKMSEMHIDSGVMNYLYDFDEYGRCTVKHLKARIVRNDGCVKWVGQLHEDLQETRRIDQYMIEDVEILHLTGEKRAGESSDRNMEIAITHEKENPDDPRSIWLMANAYMSKNDVKNASIKYKEFIEKSGSDEEKYIALLNLSDIENDTSYALKALELRPNYPNAYHKLSELWYKKRNLDRSLEFIEIGLQLPRPEHTIIVYNPRDYDYNPLMLMIRIYFEQNRFDKALAIVDTLLKNYPKDKNLINKKKLLDDAIGDFSEIESILEGFENISDKELELALMKLPVKIRQHPKVCYYRNTRIIKTESSGKDLVFYCSHTSKAWNPEIAEKDGVGGSEEAVINLSKRLVKLGWNVTVYNNCGKENKVYDGVKYKHYWEWNHRDKQDVTVIWRHPKPVDYNINSDKIFIDMHDVIPDGEFNNERLSKIDGIFLKTKAHKRIYPSIPDEKAIVIPNGLDVSMFEQKVERNPYLILNTSSADRHLESTLDVFEALIKKSKKPWKLAWYYGWGIYDQVHANDKKMMDYKERCMARFNKLVSEGRAEGGTMIGHNEIAKKYLEAGVFLYPTEFYEIHCISAAKAQAAGCKCVTSDWAALDETIKYGTKIHTEGEKWGHDTTFGVKDTSMYTKAILDAPDALYEQIEWSKKKFDWDSISKSWNKELTS